MRFRGSCLLALLLALPARSAVVRVPAGALASAAPVSALGGLLSSSLPGLPAVNALSPVPVLLPATVAAPALVPSPVPAMLDARKAAALLSRAAELPAPAPSASPAAPAASPFKVLEAVNATLRDFTPAQIRDLPAEKLRALSAVILDGAAGRAPVPDFSAASALAEASLAKAESRKGEVRETLINPGHNESHPDLITARGVPEAARRFDADGVVFRHYTTKEGLEAILGGKSLWNGILPYVQLANGVFRKTFPDLTGVFLTRPGVDGGGVGVPASEFPHYVDVRVPKGLPVLELEKGAIYLIPLPGRTRSWVADLYRRWALGGGQDPTYARGVAAVEAEGGPGPELAVPVEIVGHGRVDR